MCYKSYYLIVFLFIKLIGLHKLMEYKLINKNFYEKFAILFTFLRIMSIICI